MAGVFRSVYGGNGNIVDGFGGLVGGGIGNYVSSISLDGAIGEGGPTK